MALVGGFPGRDLWLFFLPSLPELLGQLRKEPVLCQHYLCFPKCLSLWSLFWCFQTSRTDTTWIKKKQLKGKIVYEGQCAPGQCCVFLSFRHWWCERMSPKQRYFFNCKCFFPPNLQEHPQLLNCSAWGWPKDKNGFTFQKSDFPKASVAPFSHTFTLWGLTTTRRCCLWGRGNQATRFGTAWPNLFPDSLPRSSASKPRPQKAQTARKTLGCLRLYLRGKYWNSCTAAQTFIQRLVKLTWNTLYRNKARSLASQKQSSNSKGEKTSSAFGNIWRSDCKTSFLHWVSGEVLLWDDCWSGS